MALFKFIFMMLQSFQFVAALRVWCCTYVNHLKRFYVEHDGKQKRKVVVLSKKREKQQQSNYIPFTELETLFCNAKIVPDWLVLSQANPWLFYSELKMTVQQSSTAWGPFLDYCMSTFNKEQCQYGSNTKCWWCWHLTKKKIDLGHMKEY